MSDSRITSKPTKPPRAIKKNIKKIMSADVAGATGGAILGMLPATFTMGASIPSLVVTGAVTGSAVTTVQSVWDWLFKADR